MKEYKTPRIVSFKKSDRNNYVCMDACDCGHTGSQSIPHCGGGGARA